MAKSGIYLKTNGLVMSHGLKKGIACLDKIRIGGSDQYIYVRSDNTDNPIVLFLHGGPGTSQLTLNKKNTRDLEKYFILVDWDQRGAGKSFKAIREAEKMNMEQFVQDTRELTLYLLSRFKKERIILVGHSWGSVIGALTTAKYPDLYYCYVGIGQVAHMKEGEVASYQWTLEQAKARNDKQVVRMLQKIGRPPYDGNWQNKTITQRRYLAHYGGECYASKKGLFGMVISSLLFSREYTLMDRINFFKGIFGSMKLLWPQLLQVNLFNSVPEFKIPVFFMEGRYDQEAPSSIADKYFQFIKAPSKELIWFERSAHMPNSEERDLFNKIMAEKVLPRASS
jgi:pimeloyl-ACP methyl ester carboxylesterase